ncbi:MAG: TldD/PmbA family protein [Burkholderiaceae bacterium]
MQSARVRARANVPAHAGATDAALYPALYPLRSDEALREIAHDVLAHAKKIGATDCAVDVDEGNGLTVNVRKGRIETIEQNRDKGVGVTVFLGGAKNVRRGNASTSDLSPSALRDAVEAAYHIARFTAVDEAATLPDDAWYAREERDFDLYHPWNIEADVAAEIARRAEAAALETSPLIRNSDGGNVSLQHGRFVSANSRGFIGGHAHSYHSVAVAPIASRGRDGMQRDEWYASRRDPADLPSPESVGRYAAERALSRLGARKIPTCTVPVLFEAPLAAGLLGSYVQAASGRSLYRASSFLIGKLGTRVFANHIDIVDDPFVLKGMGSGSFDDDGVATQKRTVVEAGVLTGWFLGTYSARKLGMQPTGNGGGSHNLSIRSTKTRRGDDFEAMLKKLGTGLLVTDLMGQGVNGITGDYSRGASGYWVDNGRIAYPVEEVMIAGNLLDMFGRIVAVGTDVLNGSKRTGSILIEAMTVAGN